MDGSSLSPVKISGSERVNRILRTARSVLFRVSVDGECAVGLGIRTDRDASITVPTTYRLTLRIGHVLMNIRLNDWNNLLQNLEWMGNALSEWHGTLICHVDGIHSL